MTKPRNNPELGTTTCTICGEVATVHQSSQGKGRYLYQRGCGCGFLKSSGKAFQTQLWNNTNWHPDANPVKPPNVEADTADFDPSQPITPQPEPMPADPAPVEPAPAETPTAEAPTANGGPFGRVLAGLGLIVAASFVAITGRK